MSAADRTRATAVSVLGVALPEMRADDTVDLSAHPWSDIPVMPRDIAWEHRTDGTILVRSRVPLRPLDPHVPSLLRRAAAEVPDRVWIAQRRGPERAWAGLTYGDSRRRVDAVTQALLDLRVAGRPLMVLSGNSPEHAVVEIAAMQARLPYVPVTTAYSLRATDFARLRSMVDLIDPAVLFVQDAQAYGPALDAVAASRPVVAVTGGPRTGQRWGRSVLRWEDLIATPVTPAVDASVEQITHDTVAKYLFTSGSTGTPKAVITTQGMLMTMAASNEQRLRIRDVTDHPRQVEWTPWSHVAGGSSSFCKALVDRATLYIDDGRPTPDEFAETLRNVGEIAPTAFSSMPAGYRMLADALENDPALGRRFFANLVSMTYSGARLPDEVYRRLQQQAVRHTGHRVPFLSAYGCTETSTTCSFVYWPAERPGLIGLPQAGVTLKLVPLDEGRYELRVRGGSVTPGYYRNPELTAAAFDEEGFYRLGDAASFADPAVPDEGLMFAGRVAEEFKLETGIFVRVTGLRVQALDAAAPYLREVVVAGADQPYVALLAWPDQHAAAGLGATDATDLRLFAPLRDRLQTALAAHNRNHPASSMRIRRIKLMNEPFSQQAGEINDKGYVNQRRVLDLRAGDVAQLFSGASDPTIIELA